MILKETLPKNPCVYEIRNLINGRVYIGSTINPNQRRNRHFKDLRRGIHGSRFMQRDFIKCGEMAFSFKVLEIVSVESLLQREQHWLDFVVPPYNTARIAGSSLGVKQTPEVVEANRRRGTGFSNGNAKVTPEIAEQMTALRNTETYGRIAQLFGVHISTVERLMVRMKVKKESRVYSEAMREKFRDHAKNTLQPARRINVVMLGDNGQPTREFVSMSEAAKFIGVNVCSLSEAIKYGTPCTGVRFKKADSAMLIIGR